MNIMTGYIAATDGTVEINGYDILKEPEKAKKWIICFGSKPTVGSSRIITSGYPTIACASPTRERARKGKEVYWLSAGTSAGLSRYDSRGISYIKTLISSCFPPFNSVINPSGVSPDCIHYGADADSGGKRQADS